MTPWMDDEPERCGAVRVKEPEPEARSMQSRGPTCTEAERAYLNAILDGGLGRKEIDDLRVRIAAERLNPEKRTALVRAWADSIKARERWNLLLEGVDLGGHCAPLYELLEAEATAVVESEKTR